MVTDDTDKEDDKEWENDEEESVSTKDKRGGLSNFDPYDEDFRPKNVFEIMLKDYNRTLKGIDGGLKELKHWKQRCQQVRQGLPYS